MTMHSQLYMGENWGCRYWITEPDIDNLLFTSEAWTQTFIGILTHEQLWVPHHSTAVQTT